MPPLETSRARLRLWRPEDAESYWRINQDPRVLEFLPGPLSLEQAHTFLTAANQHQVQHGYTLWAAECKQSSALMGFVGLNETTFDAPFCPAVEIGWRLGSQFWGQGVATECARAVLHYGFMHCGLAEIVSFTVPANVRSLRVMEKLGLVRDQTGDFRHPKLPLEHTLSHHVLYRIRQDGSPTP